LTDRAEASEGARVLAAHGGLVFGDPAGVRDRFMIDGKDSGDRFALVQHLFAPKALAAPMHRHHKEDEYWGSPDSTDNIDYAAFSVVMSRRAHLLS
jgi:hypothetical protein